MTALSTRRGRVRYIKKYYTLTCYAGRSSRSNILLYDKYPSYGIVFKWGPIAMWPAIMHVRRSHGLIAHLKPGRFVRLEIVVPMLYKTHRDGYKMGHISLTKRGSVEMKRKKKIGHFRNLRFKPIAEFVRTTIDRPSCRAPDVTQVPGKYVLETTINRVLAVIIIVITRFRIYTWFQTTFSTLIKILFYDGYILNGQFTCCKTIILYTRGVRVRTATINSGSLLRLVG